MLILAIGLIIFIPLALNMLVNEAANRLTFRADETPLIIGSRENTTELTLSALYFRPPDFTSLNQGFVDSMAAEFDITAIPLYLRHNVEDHPIVGTTPEYFELRNLGLSAGRMMALLGECIIGAEAAKELHVKVGESVISSPSGAFDIAGSFPLKMTITGILSRTGTSDDNAIFTDIKTAWIISGKAHGHEDVTQMDSTKLLGSSDSSGVVASAAVLSYTEITDANRDSFHFHGDPATFPVDAIIVLPSNRQESLKLRSRLESTPSVQAIVPRTIIDGLIDTLFSVNNLLILGGILIGTAALAIASLVFMLSIKLRKRELITLRKMGVSPERIRGLFATEIIIIITGSMLFCFLLLSGLSLIENNWLEKWMF